MAQLLERYLHAVGFWLPGSRKDDILRELASDLRAQVEDRERTQGRPLEEEELAAILTATGHPMKVAGDYLPAGPWLDPVTALLFRFVVKVVLLGVLTPIYGAILAGTLLVAERPLAAAASACLGFLHGYIFALGMVTLVFGVVGWFRALPGSRQARRWDPRRLPALPRPGRYKPAPLAGSVAEAILTLLFLGWWTSGARAYPDLWAFRHGVPWQPGALWTAFRAECYGPVILLSSLTFVMACTAILRPHWTRARMAFRTALDGLTLLMLAFFLAHHPLGTLLGQAAALRHTPPSPVTLALGLDLALATAIAITTVATAVAFGVRAFLLGTWKEPAAY